MRRTIRTILFAVAALTAADLTGGPFRRSPAAPPPVPGAVALGGPVETIHRTRYPEQVAAVDPRPLVWVVDGAGDLRGCSTRLAHANILAGAPLDLAVFHWSHGSGRLVRDQTDAAHASEQGKRLAADVRDRQAREPGRRTVLLAHSAGCGVALHAADHLPPDAVDRIVLVAPSVSRGYDLGPALRAAREGIDVFCSQKDWVALGFAVRVVGTTDRTHAPAAGLRGFRGETLDGCDAARLRQHFWAPEVAWTGNTGGHHGAFAPAFLHAYVFPLLGAAVR